ncbi:MAG: gamma-glutamyl-gamma-aminobutyrate hydrolase family protein [Acidobacteriaceae bacterium]|nr:gamma-glutamyl-gamma-aminobutyrate hydrolase family protein [Acidobacteriaceae bacterium]
MSGKPRVLVPYRHSEKATPYLRALESAGCEPAGFLTAKPCRLDGFSGLLLTGGTDVNPARYGERPHPETNEPDDERDQIELDLLDQAIEANIPVLAICRGMQLVNVHHGGTLTQHLDSVHHDPDLKNKGMAAHGVEVESGTRLAEMVGSARIRVNSRHHQAVARLGAELRVSGRDEQDEVIEAIEGTGRGFIVGVQWHPEDQVASDPVALRLFQRFAAVLQKPRPRN